MALFIICDGPDIPEEFAVNVDHVVRMRSIADYICPKLGARSVTRLYYPSGRYDDVFGTVNLIFQRIRKGE